MNTVRHTKLIDFFYLRDISHDISLYFDIVNCLSSWYPEGISSWKFPCANHSFHTSVSLCVVLRGTGLWRGLRWTGRVWRRCCRVSRTSQPWVWWRAFPLSLRRPGRWAGRAPCSPHSGECSAPQTLLKERSVQHVYIKVKRSTFFFFFFL